MTLIKNEDTNEAITHFVSMELSQEVIRTTQQLLSGDAYIQRIGAPTVSYNAVAYVNRAGKEALLAAEDTSALLRIVVKHGTYYGRITELKLSDRMVCDWFKADITLAREVTE